MQIERIAITELSHDPSNARKHGDRNLATIVASLRRFGQQKPIVVDLTNVVRAGNGTLDAAIALGWTHLDCVRTELQSSDAIAYAIADNRTAELAEWDDEVLAAMLSGLLQDDLELVNAAGYTEVEVDAMLGSVADLNQELSQGLPDYDGSPVGSSTLIVHFASEEDRQTFSGLVEQTISDKAKYIWYPSKPEP